MSEVCPNCFKKHDVFTSCDGKNSREYDSDFSLGDTTSSSSSSLLLGLVPFVALIFDLILPLPNSLIASLIITPLGMFLGSFLWVTLFYRGRKTLKFHARNALNYIYVPNMVKVFGVQSSVTKAGPWVGVVIASIVLQLVIFSPGNASAVASGVSDRIESSTNQRLVVSCPTTLVISPSTRITCEIETGVLAITVPARVTLNPIALNGVAKVDISLL